MSGVTVEIRSAVVFEGRIARPGESLSVPSAFAEGLVRRGKAVRLPDKRTIDRSALEEEYKELGGRPQDDWSDEELVRRLDERREKAEE